MRKRMVAERTANAIGRENLRKLAIGAYIDKVLSEEEGYYGGQLSCKMRPYGYNASETNS